MSKDKKKDVEVVEYTGTVHADDRDFAEWIMNLWRGGESPQRLDVVQVDRAGGLPVEGEVVAREAFAPGQAYDFEKAANLSNRLLRQAQRDQDTRVRNKKGASYTVRAWNDAQSAKAYDTFSLLLYMSRQQMAQQAAARGVIGEDDEEEVDGKKMMLTVFKEVLARDDKGLEREGKIAGDLLNFGLEMNRDLRKTVNELIASQLLLVKEFAEMAKDAANRRVEEKALDIEEKDRQVDREKKRAEQAWDAIKGDLARKAGMEAIGALGKLVPGIFDYIMNMRQGDDGESPQPQPQVAASNLARLFGPATQPQPTAPAPAPPPATASPVAPAPAQPQPQLAPVPEEVTLVNRFVDACRKAKIDEQVFGEDDAAGNVVKPGIFTREQVAIFAGVRSGRLPVDALDAFLTDSGKPEAVTSEQMGKAVVLLMPHPEILQDVTRFMELRTAARTR